MKKILQTLFISMSSLAFAQGSPVLVTVNPDHGCGGITHSVYVTVKNNTPYNIISYEVNIAVKDAGSSLGTLSIASANSQPIEASGEVTLEISDVDFSSITVAKNCSIYGEINDIVTTVTPSGIDYPVNIAYPVKVIEAVTIVDNAGTFEITSPANLDGNLAKFYNVNTPANYTTGTSFTPSDDGTYMAMIYDPWIDGCEVVSNQLTFSKFPIEITPVEGCPNTTHDVNLKVTNNSGATLGSPMIINFTLRVRDAVKDTIKTFSYSPGPVSIAHGESITMTIADVPFGDAGVYDIGGKVNAFIPAMMSIDYPIAYTNYNIENVPTLAIEQTGSALTLKEVDEIPAHYAAVYYLDGIAKDTTTEITYTPDATGVYTVKAARIVHSTDLASDVYCYSASASNSISMTVTAIEEAQAINISVYPNPVVSSVTIAAGVSSELTYELADMNGAIVRSASFNGVVNINAEALKAGSYILVVKNHNQKIASYKLVK